MKNHREWIPVITYFIMLLVTVSDGDCPEPTKPLHGSISFTGTDVGATAEQSCDTGYSMTGVSVITCLENELWSHGPVTCTPIECATPVSPDNGSITYTGTYVGATAEQSCNTGYTLNGVKVISCLADGLWSHPPVKCTLKETKKCRWSNEGCSQNEDCCSGGCVQQHEGTDPRCVPSPMHYPCFYSYQCESGLACGNQYSCCSPFWGVCTKTTECCDQIGNVCRPEEGYTYKRCLMPGNSGIALFLSIQSIGIVTAMHIFYSLF